MTARLVGMTITVFAALWLTACGWPLWAVAIVAGLTGLATRYLWEV